MHALSPVLDSPAGVLVFRVPELLSNPEGANEAIERMITPHGVVGFDIERTNPAPGEKRDDPKRVDVISLSSGTETVLLYVLNNRAAIPVALSKLLQAPTLKVGVAIRDDAHRLLTAGETARNFVDLSLRARATQKMPWFVDPGRIIGLKPLVEHYCRQRILVGLEEKFKRIWHELDPEHIVYAASDAIAACQVYLALQAIEPECEDKDVDRYSRFHWADGEARDDNGALFVERDPFGALNKVWKCPMCMLVGAKTSGKVRHAYSAVQHFAACRLRLLTEEAYRLTVHVAVTRAANNAEETALSREVFAKLCDGRVGVFPVEVMMIR